MAWPGCFSVGVVEVLQNRAEREKFSDYVRERAQLRWERGIRQRAAKVQSRQQHQPWDDCWASRSIPAAQEFSVSLSDKQSLVAFFLEF